MVNNSELRARARKQLGGNIFATAWLLMLVACLISSVIIGATSYIIIGIVLVYGPMMYGLSKVLLEQARGAEKPNIGTLFKGFSDDFGGLVLLGFLQALFLTLWSLLFVVPGIIKSYSYSMAFYIKNDDISKDWKTCINESRAMMNGKKWKLFCLDLSFIGWYILGSLCLGVGVLFVIPYHEMARANFYEELKVA